jgi:hypothetical protein
LQLADDAAFVEGGVVLAHPGEGFGQMGVSENVLGRSLPAPLTPTNLKRPCAYGAPLHYNPKSKLYSVTCSRMAKSPGFHACTMM